MDFYVLTLFPEMTEQGMTTSMTGRALEKGLLRLFPMNIRDFAKNKHFRVDDYPYGGGAGLVMQPEPVYHAYQEACNQIKRQSGKEKKPRVIYVTPQGQLFHQSIAKELAKEEELIFLCGHYEGIDERVLEEIVTDHISIGDYILTGGELPAMVMMDCISRLIPNVLHNKESVETESLEGNLLEYPQYTRPEVFHGKKVPSVLLSGHHANIETWRYNLSIERTKERRPDLFEKYVKEQK